MSKSMNNLEKLSDDELRLRLLEYGFPNLPVTDTTRKVLIKKLQNYMNNEKEKRHHSINSITKYSSDEESDIDSKRNYRQNTMSISNQSISSSSSALHSTNSTRKQKISSIRSRFDNSFIRKIDKPSQSQEQQSQFICPQPNKSIIHVTPIIVSDVDTDEDYDQNYSKTTQNYNLNSLSSPYSLNTCPRLYSSGSHTLLDSHKSIDDSQNHYSSNYSKNNESKTNISGDSQQQSSLHNGFNINNSNDSQYFSDFTRRLLNLRGETIRESANNNNRQRVSSLSSSSSSHLYPQLSSISPDPNEIKSQTEPRIDQNISLNAAFSDFWNKLDEQYGVQQTLIPCVLLTSLILFFVFVAFMYMTINPDLTNTVSGKVTIYNTCELDSSSKNYSDYCINKHSLEETLNLLKLIAPELQERAELHNCVDKKIPYTLSEKEIIDLVEKRKSEANIFEIDKTIENLHNLEYLISKNPQWRISHVDNEGNILTFEKVVELRKTRGNYFAIMNPKLPFLCSFFKNLQKFLFLAGGAGLLLTVLGICYFIHKCFINYQQSKKNNVLHFIDEITNTLMRSASGNSERNIIVVNHLRDKLIPVHKKKKLEWAWNEAIKFLEQNESRIHFSLATRNGERVKLMRWLNTGSLEQFDQKLQIKKWHSSAFDKTNKIANPPTPCLKIRQMFDKFEANNPNLKIIIQDAILEKVGPNCKIYDIQLDKATCCVYVRCASLKDAGIVHNEINGWWFDKKLVSIKFLRLERYLNRFPKSLVGPACLYPSNTQNLSMSQCAKENDYDLSSQRKIGYDDDDVD